MGILKSTPHRFKFVVSDQGKRKEPTEVLIETFIRKQLRLKAHTVTKVEESEGCMLVHIDRLGKRLLRCGVCRQRCREVHHIRAELLVIIRKRPFLDFGRAVLPFSHLA